MIDEKMELHGEVSGRGLPQAKPDNTDSGPIRFGRYDEAMVVPIVNPKIALADEGSYFVGTTPTPGTGIAMTISTSFSDTVAMFAIQNTDDEANNNNRRIYLDYLRLILSGTAPTAVVSRHFAGKRSRWVDREPTTAANKTLVTPVNIAGSSGRTSIARVLSYSAAAAMTVPASSPADPVTFRACLPTGLGVAGDEYILKFGSEDFNAKVGLTAVRATDVARITAHAPPIIIEPGEWFVLHEWCLTEATNGPTFEYELGWWER